MENNKNAFQDPIFYKKIPCSLHNAINFWNSDESTWHTGSTIVLWNALRLLFHAVWDDIYILQQKTVHAVCLRVSDSVWENILSKLWEQLWYLTPQGQGSFLSQMASVQWKKPISKLTFLLFLTQVQMSSWRPSKHTFTHLRNKQA